MSNLNIIHTFFARDSDSENLVKYVIADLRENYFEDAILFIKEHFLPDEIEAKSRGVLNDKIACQDDLNLRKKKMENGKSLVCVKEGSSQIIAIVLNQIRVKGEVHKTLKINSKIMKNYLELLDVMDTW